MYCWENKVLQLAKAVVNSRPSLPFQQMFDRLFWLKIKQEQFRVLYSIFVLNKVKTGVLKRNFRLNYLRSTSFSNVIRHHFSLCELDHVQNGGSKPRSLSQSIRPHVFTKWQANNLSLKVSWSKTKRRAHFYDIIKGPSWGNMRAKIGTGQWASSWHTGGYTSYTRKVHVMILRLGDAPIKNLHGILWQ